MGRKKITALACAGALFACVAVAALSTFLRGWPKTRTHPVDIYDLMTDVSAFPQEGWDVGVGPAPKPERERGEIESIYVEFWHESFEQAIGGTWHDVFRYRNELEAGRNFSKHRFLNRHIITPWAVPQEWSYESPVAHRFKFACAEVDVFGRPDWTCQAVAQYDEYTSVFHTRLGPEYMMLEDVERILVAIDDRMAFYLEEDRE